MLTMTQVNSIREMFFEKGMNYAQIARVTGCDVKTIKKYMFKDDFKQPEPKIRIKRCSKLDKKDCAACPHLERCIVKEQKRS